MALLVHNQPGITGSSFVSMLSPLLIYKHAHAIIFFMSLCYGKLETEVAKKNNLFLPSCPFKVRILGCGFSVPLLLLLWLSCLVWQKGQSSRRQWIPSGLALLPAGWLHTQLLLPHPRGRFAAPFCAPQQDCENTQERSLSTQSASTRIVLVVT